MADHETNREHLAELARRVRELDSEDLAHLFED